MPLDDPADRARHRPRLGTGEPITAGEARRLACTAGLIPAVLGTKSEVLDLGRTARLFTTRAAQGPGAATPAVPRRALHVPAPWCEAHHATPWSHGGKTDLNDGLLLCHWHHKRAHDPRYTHRTHCPTATSATTDERDQRRAAARASR